LLSLSPCIYENTDKKKLCDYPHFLLCREVLQRLESEAEDLCIESDSIPSLQQEVSLLAQKVSGEGISSIGKKVKKCSFTIKLNN
jgi:hypothetical protein